MAHADHLPLYLAPKARRDLEDIYLYTQETWGAVQADRYLDTLGSVFNALSEMPEMGRVYTEFTPAVRIHPSGRHLIIYLDTTDQLQIIRVLGARQNWRALLDAIDG